MTLRAVRRVAGASLLVLGLSHCDDANAPEPEPQKLVDVLLDFCANDLPVWFAVQAEGEPWTPLTANAEGTYAFTANNHTTLAFVHQNGTDYATDVVYATSTDLERISGHACLEESGSKTLNGTVTGFSGAQRAVVGMNFSSVTLDPPQTSFSLTQLAERSLDLVATRLNVAGNTQLADRLILRRSLNLVSNSTMPTLDFNGPEAVVPSTINVTVSGYTAGETTLLQNNLFTQLETSHTLSAVAGASNGSMQQTVLPATLLAAVDYHDLFAFSISAAGLVRGVERFFHDPADQTLAIGNALAAPTVTTLATSPSVRLRTRLSHQSEYGSAITVDFSQQHVNLSVTQVALTATEGYSGGATWSVDIPDLSGVSGWQNGWGLVSGGGVIEWTVSGYNTRPELLFGAAPTSGETVAFASRTSQTNALRAGIRPPSVRRPRLFGRGR